MTTTPANDQGRTVNTTEVQLRMSLKWEKQRCPCGRFKKNSELARKYAETHARLANEVMEERIDRERTDRKFSRHGQRSTHWTGP